MREHRPAAVVAFRRLGISVDDVGEVVSWSEAISILQHELGDTTSPLFADVQGWAFPASHAELLQMAAAAGGGNKAKRVMPWTLGEEARGRERRRVSADERERGLALLRQYSAMRDLEGFDV